MLSAGNLSTSQSVVRTFKYENGTNPPRELTTDREAFRGCATRRFVNHQCRLFAPAHLLSLLANAPPYPRAST